MMAPSRDCACEACVRACEVTPGWFMPGEAEKAAELLQIPFDVFSKKFLIKDHCTSPFAEDAPYIWSPRKASDDPEAEIRSHMKQRARSACVFLKEGRCSIHAAKPHECRVVLPCDYKADGIRDDLEGAWIKAGAPLGMREQADEDSGIHHRMGPLIEILGYFD